MKKLLQFTFLFCTQVLMAQSSAEPDSLSASQVANIPIHLGYGTTTFEQQTVPVTSLRSGQMNQGLIYDWNQLWQGRVPGMLVTRPGGNIHREYDLRIRGLHTLYGSIQPLYVLDGIPGVSPQSIDPADIASVEVLRGATATAIYGGRGSSGVILLHSRQPEKGFRVKYSAQFGSETAATRVPVMQSPEFIALGGIDQFPNDNFETDWQNEVLTRAFSNAHHLNLSSGWGHGGFVRTNLHYRNQEGTLKPMSFQQMNGDIAVGQAFLDDKITMQAGASYFTRNANLGQEEAYQYAITANPTTPIKSDEARFEPYDGYTELDLFKYYNPVSMIEQNQLESNRRNALYYAKATATLIPGFSLSASAAQDRSDLINGIYSPLTSKYFQGFTKSYSEATNQSSRRSMFEMEANAQRQISKLSLQGMLGYGWQRQDLDNHNFTLKKNSPNSIALLGLNDFSDLVLEQDSLHYGLNRFRDQSADLVSFFGRFNADWDDTYFFQMTARRDGSGALGENAQWGIFPAISFGVNAARWLKISSLDVLKPRFSWGESGMGPSTTGLSKWGYAQGASFSYDGNYRPSIYPTRNPNPDLGWERTRETNFGVDVAMLNHRLTYSFDWYRFKSQSLISPQRVEVPNNVADETYENALALSGKGVEMALNYAAIQTNNLSWDINLSASHLQQTIDHLLPKDSDVLNVHSIGSPGGCCTTYHLYRNGSRLGELSGLVYEGVDAFGRAIYTDFDKDGFISDEDSGDNRPLGQGLPKWELGLQQQVRTGHWTFAMAFRSVIGHSLANTARYFYESADPTRVSWNRVKTSYYDPALRFNIQFSDRFVEKATFHRLQYLSAAYTFQFENTFIRSLQLQAGASNPITITRYTGLDPEVRQSSGIGESYWKEGALSAGADRLNLTPPARGFWLGLTAGF